MEKKPVSDAVKRAAAQKAAEAQKAAKAAPKKAAPAAEAPKAAPAGDKSKVKGLRIGAIVLWVLALAFEVGAFIAFSYGVRNNALFTAEGSFNFLALETKLLLAAVAFDVIFAVVAAQLWKKSNAISPCLASSAFVRTVWHQLGVIMFLICFLPIGIFLAVKSDKLNPKVKTILIVALAAIFVGATTSSVDFQQPSAEKVQELQAEAIAQGGGEEVYWTAFGKSYHFDRNCQHIRNKTEVELGGTLYSGTLQDAFDANRWDPCDTCAGGADVKLEDVPTEALEAVAEAVEEAPAA